MFTDRVAELLRELEDRELARLLVACAPGFDAGLDAGRRAELRSLAEYVLGATRRAWDRQRRALPVFLVEAWYEANGSLPEPLDPPQIGPTWAELHPAARAFGGDHAELRRTDEWLALAQALTAHDPDTARALGFPEREAATLEHLVAAVTKVMHSADQDLRALAQQILARVRDLAPALVPLVEAPRPDDRWWAPEDIAAPPTTERVTPTPPLFTREDVDSVLRDL